MLSLQDLFSISWHAWLNIVEQQWNSSGTTANYKSLCMPRGGKVRGSLTKRNYYSIKLKPFQETMTETKSSGSWHRLGSLCPPTPLRAKQGSIQDRAFTGWILIRHLKDQGQLKKSILYTHYIYIYVYTHIRIYNFFPCL